MKKEVNGTYYQLLGGFEDVDVGSHGDKRGRLEVSPVIHESTLRVELCEGHIPISVELDTAGIGK